MFRKKVLFREVAELVLRLRDLTALETRKSAGQWIPRLVRAFGELPIGDVREEHWGQYVAGERRRRERKFFTDRKWMRVILKFALERGLAKRRIPLPIPDLPWDVGRELTDCELVLLRENASGELRFQIDLGWQMGLRLRSELLSLRSDQVDLDLGVIRLGVTTKTRRARQVPIPPDLLLAFAARMPESAALYLFPSPQDPHEPRRSNRTAWRRLLAKTGVSARFHDLRHTCASRMLRAGIRREVVRRYLGMSEEVLERIYTHLRQEDLRAAARAMIRKAK